MLAAVKERIPNADDEPAVNQYLNQPRCRPGEISKFLDGDVRSCTVDDIQCAQSQPQDMTGLATDYLMNLSMARGSGRIESLCIYPNQLVQSAAPIVSQLWAGGHAESSGAGVTLLHWLNVMVGQSNIFKAYW